MYYFGIDWSQDHHDLCILNRSGARVSQVRFENSFKGFERIEAERRLLDVPAVECPVAIETSYHLVVDFLLDHGYVVYIIPPQATKSYRNRHRSSGAHTDKSDAALLASILLTDRDSHRLWRPNEPLTQEMLAQVRLIETLRRSIIAVGLPVTQQPPHRSRRAVFPHRALQKYSLPQSSLDQSRLSHLRPSLDSWPLYLIVLK
jgi:transposase